MTASPGRPYVEVRRENPGKKEFPVPPAPPTFSPMRHVSGKRIRVQKRPVRPRDDRHDPLPLDPRDPDVLRAKSVSPRAAEGSSRH